ncbi:MAG: esterase-like activity of phytase family protein [Pseudomonadota bacterium]
MAQSVDSSKLYPLIEGPIWDPAAGDAEKVDGHEYLRLLEFDLATRSWTANTWRYSLEANGHNIGDFNIISETRGLVIERDRGEGDPDQACAEGSDGLDCFLRPAEFKRVYLIELCAPGEAVEKLTYVDLMDIANPDGMAWLGKREDGRFTLPSTTIENVDIVDSEHIIVSKDNKLPFSTGRQIGAADPDEWIPLHFRNMLK